MCTCVGTLGVQPWVIHVVSSIACVYVTLALRCVAVGRFMSSIACVYVPLGANKQIDLSAVSGKGRHLSLGGDRAGSVVMIT